MSTGAWIGRSVIWALFAVVWLILTLVSCYPHALFAQTKADGIRRAENVTAAELFEHLPEARPHVPASALDVTYVSGWFRGGGTAGWWEAEYGLTQDDFDRALEAGKAGLTPFKGSLSFGDFEYWGEGYYEKTGTRATLSCKVFDTRRTRVVDYFSADTFPRCAPETSTSD
jgi:hypothetical protein